MSRSLVTGAAGFIGRRLVLALCSDGVEVRALVRHGHDAEDLEVAGAHVLRGDASDRATVLRAAEGCNVIYHLAAARGKRKLGHRVFQERNRALSEAVGSAAVAAGVGRVVFTSAASVTGCWGPEPQDEDTPPRPNSAYRSSRVEDERFFDHYAATHGLDLVTARVSQRVLGPGARDWVGTVRSVNAGRIRVLPAGGSVHSADVDDVVEGLRRCAHAPGIGRRYLLAAPAPMSTLALLRCVADHLGVPFAPRVVPAAPFRSYVALGNVVYRWTHRELPYHFTAEFYSARISYDVSRARRELGFSPRFGMAESVARTVSWMREHGLL